MSMIIDGTNGLTFNDSSTQTVSATNATNLTSGTIPFARLPAGSVLQVVNASYGTTVSTSTASWTDTGLTATITPKFASSKILVLVDQIGLSKSTDNAGMYLQLIRNGTFILQLGSNEIYNSTTTLARVGGVGANYLDSPATTSALTYKTQVWSWINRSQVSVQDGPATSTITLMEIAQ
jgi:hypothetical protein